ncbi:class I tRNA ligase family protein [Mycoplasma sp. ATU-Cv-703]|uniref:class I tRNA ligase family protein n=1 Tax=Mycoplasma sp. ATU-Cv-703 TaxID=2498595 RepID=UPI000FDEE494
MAGNELLIYVCGPTVYDEAHVGNFRPILTFDLFVRAQKSLGKKVHLIHNITDIDDKIIARAEREKTSASEVARKYTKLYKDLLKFYNVTCVSKMPLVTRHVKDMQNIIQQLLDKKSAYQSEGNVFFNVERARKHYGEVSAQSFEQMVSPTESSDPSKKHPSDFALWKKTLTGQRWNSPWSKGRPGWHTECVALIERWAQGHKLDWHGGGVDLIFPHHENENIQFRTIHGKPITTEWKHVGLVNWKDTKMAKSLGNWVSAVDFGQKHGFDTLRMIYLMTSPTSPVDLGPELIDQASLQVKRWHHVHLQSQLERSTGFASEQEKQVFEQISQQISQWNFSAALKVIHAQLKLFHEKKTSGYLMRKIFALLGFKFSVEKLTDKQRQLYQRWTLLRTKQDYQAADKIRALLIKQGLI